MYDDRDGYRGSTPQDWLARGASMTPVADMATGLLAGPRRRTPVELDVPDPPPRPRAVAVRRLLRLLIRVRAQVVDGV